MQQRIFIFLFAGFFACSACHQMSEAQNGALPYFSLSTFAQQQYDSLKKLRLSYTLSIYYPKDSLLQHTRDTNVLKKYLQQIANADINYKGLDSAYEASLTHDDVSGLLTLVYTSRGRHTQPYQIQLGLNRENNINTLYIRSYTNHWYCRRDENLFYKSGEMIRIIQTEKWLFFPQKRTIIQLKMKQAAL